MVRTRSATLCVLGVALALATSAAKADDEASAIHGFSDVTFLSSYITPRGYVLNNDGFSTQADLGLSVDLYKNPTGPINAWSVTGGMWVDFWENSNFAAPISNDGWYEDDWWLGTSVTLGDWKLSAQIEQFRSPVHLWNDQDNAEFDIAYDLPAWGGFKLNPSLHAFWAIAGTSTVGYGSQGHSYYFQPTLTPSYTFADLPLTITAPTWVSIGPAGFWNGDPAALKNTGNVGVFSTGLTFTTPLQFIPAKFGKWYAKAGFQIYDLINDNLVLAEEHRGGVPSSDRTPVVAFTGFGVSF